MGEFTSYMLTFEQNQTHSKDFIQGVLTMSMCRTVDKLHASHFIPSKIDFVFAAAIVHRCLLLMMHQQNGSSQKAMWDWETLPCARRR